MFNEGVTAAARLRRVRLLERSRSSCFGCVEEVDWSR